MCRSGALQTNNVIKVAVNSAPPGVLTWRTQSTRVAEISTRTKSRLSRRIEIGLAVAKI
jgi:hypothetical protein